MEITTKKFYKNKRDIMIGPHVMLPKGQHYYMMELPISKNKCWFLEANTDEQVRHIISLEMEGTLSKIRREAVKQNFTKDGLDIDRNNPDTVKSEGEIFIEEEVKNHNLKLFACRRSLTVQHPDLHESAEPFSNTIVKEVEPVKVEPVKESVKEVKLMETSLSDLLHRNITFMYKGAQRVGMLDAGAKIVMLAVAEIEGFDSRVVSLTVNVNQVSDIQPVSLQTPAPSADPLLEEFISLYGNDRTPEWEKKLEAYRTLNS